MLRSVTGPQPARKEKLGGSEREKLFAIGRCHLRSEDRRDGMKHTPEVLVHPESLLIHGHFVRCRICRPLCRAGVAGGHRGRERAVTARESGVGA